MNTETPDIVIQPNDQTSCELSIRCQTFLVVREDGEEFTVEEFSMLARIGEVANDNVGFVLGESDNDVVGCYVVVDSTSLADQSFVGDVFRITAVSMPYLVLQDCESDSMLVNSNEYHLVNVPNSFAAALGFETEVQD